MIDPSTDTNSKMPNKPAEAGHNGVWAYLRSVEFKLRARRAAPALLLAILTVLIFLPVIRAEANDFWGDLQTYSFLIQHIGNRGGVTSPNFLYPLLIFTISSLTGFQSINTIDVTTTTTSYVLLALVLLYMLRTEVPGMTNPASISRSAWGIFFVLSMMLLAPAAIIMFGRQEQYYLGYIAMAVYHNPNMSLERPLCLLHFFLLARFIRDPAKMKPVMLYCLMPVLIVLTALAKPSYLIALLPSTFLYCVYQVSRKQPVPLKQLFFAVFLPGLCILGWQYSFTYLHPNPDLQPAKVVWAPFFAYGLRSDELLPKFVLSVLFPVGVLSLYWTELREDKEYLFALALLIAGLVINYGFSESGRRASDLNFSWTGQITLFIFTVYSALRVIGIENLLTGVKKSANGKLSRRLTAVSLLFALHLVSGIMWYFRELTAPGYYS
jgi:hypothetical protein